MSRAAGRSTLDGKVVHVDVERLDGLLNLVGSLVIHRTKLTELGQQARARCGFKEQVLDLNEATEQVNRIIDEVQAQVIGARMVPVGTLFERFKGIVADMSTSTGKQIVLHIQGESAEIDKKIIDELADPLVHLVRNALDHGIETTVTRERLGKPPHGTVTLGAFHEGNHLVIEVRDDGAGIDLDAVRRSAIRRGFLGAAQAEGLQDDAVVDLLFRTSFSTSDRVTGLSGRGVGLDVAKRRVEMLGGTIGMESVKGQGCCARIKLPLTMAIVEALLVAVGSETYAVPIEHVTEIVRATADSIVSVEGHETLQLRSEALSLLRLASALEVEQLAPPVLFPVVVVASGGKRIGLVADRVVRRQQIVVKPLGRRLLSNDGLSGASIASDGSVFLILDVPALCAQGTAHMREHPPADLESRDREIAGADEVEKR